MSRKLRKARESSPRPTSDSQINIPRFILVYCGILIPTLLISFFSGQSVLAAQKKRETARWKQQLVTIAENFDTQFTSYVQSAIVLSNQSDLRPAQMVDNDASAHNGISLLKSSFINLDVTDVFVYYGRGKLYSRIGLTGQNAFFRDVLFLSEKDARTINDSLTESQTFLAPIQMTDGRVRLLIHVPVDMGAAAPGASVNLLLSDSALSGMLKQFTNMSGSYIRFRFAEKGELCYSGDGTAPAVQVTSKELPDDSDSYVSISHTAQGSGLTFEVFYPTNEIYRDVNRWQRNNIFLYSLASLLSLLLAFLFSRNQERQISAIERMLDGEEVQPPRFGLFNRLFDRAQAVVREKSEFQRGMRTYQARLRRQAAQLIFRGTIQQPAAVAQLLEFCGLVLCEKNYYIGCLTVSHESQLDTIDQFMNGDLHTDTTVNGKRAIVFLAELPCADPTLSMRDRLSRKLADVIDTVDAGDIQIAMSSVYDNLRLASQAYMEATWCMEKMEASDDHLRLAYWEQLARNASVTITLNPADLQALSAALQKKRMIAAIGALERMEYDIAAGCASAENQRYLRYCILQAVVAQLTTCNCPSNYVEEALRFDPTDSAAFSSGLHDLITRYCALRTPESHFEKVLVYIDANYQRYDLSLEEIADHVALSKNYLSNLFRTQIGVKYMEYLTALRMSKVQTLLTDTDLPIAEVFRMVGYVDKANYSKKFKSIFRVSAMEVRRAARENRMDTLPFRYPTDDPAPFSFLHPMGPAANCICADDDDL